MEHRKPFPEYGTIAWRAWDYQRMKDANRGNNFEYWNDKKHGVMLDNGWELYVFGIRNGIPEESTASSLLAKEIVEKLRSENNFARVIAGYEKNVQRMKMFSVIYKLKKNEQNL